MTTIWKFQLAVTDVQSVPMPAGAHVMPFVATGDPELGAAAPLFVWAYVDTDAPVVTSTFYVVGTGNPLPKADMQYVGTALQGPFVWHVHEAKKDES